MAPCCLESMALYEQEKSASGIEIVVIQGSKAQNDEIASLVAQQPENVQEMCGVAYKRENVYVCPDLYLFRTPGYQDFVTAANWHLRERFLFATGYPQVPLNLMVEWYHTCGIRPEVLDNIFYHNAARLLKMM